MKEKVRYEFVDLLRGIAIIVMIEVHVFNAFLSNEIRSESWFSVLNFINGLVAPSFLFVSGFAFYISVINSGDEIRKFGSVFFKRLKRILQILLIGYTLHIPFYSFAKIINEATAADIIKLFNVDILQCIAGGLLVLLLLRIIIKNNQYYFRTIIILTLTVIIFSPMIWNYDWDNLMPIPFSNYLNERNGSLFPIFPWIGFIFSGAIVSKYFIDAQKAGGLNELSKKIFFISAIFIVAGHILLSGILPQSINSIQPNPIFFILRLSYVTALLSAGYFITEIKSLKLKFIYDASRESLLIYWLHLQIIYLRIFSGKNLEDIINHSFGVAESSAAALTLILLMIAAAKGWGNFKQKNQHAARTSAFVFSTIIVIVFVII